MPEPTHDATPWLSAAEIEDWKAVVALISTLPAALDAQLKRDAGLSLYEYHVLVSLAEGERQELPMSDLARLTQSSPSRLSHAVGRLEQAGWVVRGDCSAAGKRTSARLTAAGTAQLERSAPGHVREVRRLVVDALGPERVAALGDAARTVVGGAAPDVAATLWPCGGVGARTTAEQPA
ncbi:MarR family winged helix-turn-helix transcriptional regulator [Cellulomonas sp. Marseille-Q8402]